MRTFCVHMLARKHSTVHQFVCGALARELRLQGKSNMTMHGFCLKQILWKLQSMQLCKQYYSSFDNSWSIHLIRWMIQFRMI
mmetsp:Transcript_856/g.5363  ORF Transcript_856/g.5363 Transcript_856/m.5363 type:complete len:82 (+) Transcript_856:399-644(+)